MKFVALAFVATCFVAALSGRPTRPTIVSLPVNLPPPVLATPKPVHGGLPLPLGDAPYRVGPVHFVAFCGGCILDTPLGEPPPNPTLELTTALLSATQIELWSLGHLERPEALVRWDAFRYRDSVITGFERSRDPKYIIRIIAELADVLESAEDADIYMDEMATRPENLNPMLFHSGPEFVVTLSGPHPLRIEVDSYGIVLIENKDRYGWLTISLPRARQLMALASTLRLPDNPQIVPRVEFP